MTTDEELRAVSTDEQLTEWCREILRNWRNHPNTREVAHALLTVIQRRTFINETAVAAPPQESWFDERARIQPAQAATGWEPIHTVPECDDLLWFCRGDTYEGPRAPCVDDADYWDWWCYAVPPSLPPAPQGQTP